MELLPACKDVKLMLNGNTSQMKIGGNLEYMIPARIFMSSATEAVI